MTQQAASEVINIVVAGIGGQGVLTASDIAADAAFRAGLDVKKSEIHGMSQRGGSVTSDVRIGDSVLSPMVPAGQADYLVVVSPDQVEPNRRRLADCGTLLTAEMIDPDALPNKRSINVALLGLLSRHLDISETCWLEAIQAALPERLHDVNNTAFRVGRTTARR